MLCSFFLSLKIFNSFDYIYGLEPKYTYTKTKRFHFGEVSLNYDVEKNIIINFKITGDFFENKNICELEQSLIGIKLQDLKIDIEVNEYIDNMSKEEFLKLLKG